MAKGLLSYMAVGAAAGIGTSLIEEAKQTRAEALAKLNQEFTAGENQKTRDASATQNELTRKTTVEQNDLNRQHQTQLAADKDKRDASDVTKVDQDEDGNFIGFTRGGATVRTGVKGAKPGTANRQPSATVQTSEWLARQKAAAEGREVTAQDYVDSFEAVNTAKESPSQRAALVVRAYDAMKRDFNDTRTDDEKRAAAETMIGDLVNGKTAGAPKPAAAPKPAGDGGKPAPKPKVDDIPSAPRDPAQRQTGQVYKAADGRKVEWTGKGWKLVQ